MAQPARPVFVRMPAALLGGGLVFAGGVGAVVNDDKRPQRKVPFFWQQVMIEGQGRGGVPMPAQEESGEGDDEEKTASELQREAFRRFGTGSDNPFVNPLPMGDGPFFPKQPVPGCKVVELEVTTDAEVAEVRKWLDRSNVGDVTDGSLGWFVENVRRGVVPGARVAPLDPNGDKFQKQGAFGNQALGLAFAVVARVEGDVERCKLESFVGVTVEEISRQGQSTFQVRDAATEAGSGGGPPMMDLLLPAPGGGPPGNRGTRAHLRGGPGLREDTPLPGNLFKDPDLQAIVGFDFARLPLGAGRRSIVEMAFKFVGHDSNDVKCNLPVAVGWETEYDRSQSEFSFTGQPTETTPLAKTRCPKKF